MGEEGPARIHRLQAAFREPCVWGVDAVSLPGSELPDPQTIIVARPVRRWSALRRCS
jgi:hypothetical protein